MPNQTKHWRLAEIDPPELLETLKKIEQRGALEVTARTKQICGQVCAMAFKQGAVIVILLLTSEEHLKHTKQNILTPFVRMRYLNF